ncbi:hypothetical protein FRB91_007780 [Serendipita sp. 411]|nr:hypothetical protein FRB91_007780 [Serendipita sp. 411]
MSWSLETLDLRLELEQEGDPTAFSVEGLIIEGATWRDDRLIINDGESVSVGRSQVRWVHSENQAQRKTRPGYVNLPVYLNGDRSDDLFTVDLPFSQNDELLSVVRAVCLTAGGVPSA